MLWAVFSTITPLVTARHNRLQPACRSQRMPKIPLLCRRRSLASSRDPGPAAGRDKTPHRRARCDANSDLNNARLPNPSYRDIDSLALQTLPLSSFQGLPASSPPTAAIAADAGAWRCTPLARSDALHRSFKPTSASAAVNGIAGLCRHRWRRVRIPSGPLKRPPAAR
ncbi:hypothetical protein B0J12DRAFT_206406 [Macrophomina phaseolina]|uniref:Uncharacterized protein n=1 Tax=Macrophomina phaseolina TaxID=35725 RepID=A0ABQ8G2A2_9PEZI|nr:hypothetical protein B0J12DRAFT_206406 [Macrophomina phaseolina]